MAAAILRYGGICDFSDEKICSTIMLIQIATPVKTKRKMEMSSTYKTQLGLSKWLDSDKPRMEDFNKDNELVDEKLRQLTAEKADKPIYTSSGNGYHKDSSGFTIQWGTAIMPGSTDTPINLPIAFTQIFGVQATLRGGGQAIAAQADTVSVAQILLRHGYPGSAAVMWLAYGNISN